MSSRNRLLFDYKRKAKMRNLVWELSAGKAEELFSLPCFYCKAPPASKINIYLNLQGKLRDSRSKTHSQSKLNATFVFNGIDRKDNNLGYTEENCVSCCAICNRAKGTLEFKDFIAWISNLTKRP
jgi:hypothetical protein